MSIMPELKPCPFCGGNARLFVGGGVRVLCTKCKASSMVLQDREVLDLDRAGAYGVVEYVINAWNTRVSNRGADDGNQTDSV